MLDFKLKKKKKRNKQKNANKTKQNKTKTALSHRPNYDTEEAGSPTIRDHVTDGGGHCDPGPSTTNGDDKLMVVVITIYRLGSLSVQILSLIFIYGQKLPQISDIMNLSKPFTYDPALVIII